MTIAPGVLLSRYRITAALGAGGMGEVWRAEDERLGREVAIKVLPEGFAQDPERLARFEREARVLASLNHPNIAHLYGLETVRSGADAGEDSRLRTQDSRLTSDAGAGGKSEIRSPKSEMPAAAASPEPRASSPVTFLVMELVEGEDLSERIKRGAIPLDEVIPIALQIAEALEAAHEAGIVHRDLKPANVKLAEDGRVKVLDFGLAKAWQSDGSEASSSMSPTLTRNATLEGVILGTAAYMSPEQARGKKVDKRSDIWAFGVVLWEMLSGSALFHGETVTDVLAAVVRQEIDLGALPGATPAVLRRLLARCLDRDPKQRLRDIGEARIALAARPQTDEPSSGPERPPGLTRRQFAVTSALTGAGAILGFGLGRMVTGRDQPGPGGVSLEITRLTNSGNVISASISPDGRYIAYVESDQGLQSLWLRQLASGQTLRLIPDRPDFYWGHTFSPDGNDVVFGLKTSSDPTGGCFAISTLGGTRRRLVTGIDSSPSFSPDAGRMAYVRAGYPSAEESALMVAGADGSDPKPLAVYRLPEFVAPIFFGGPTWSPDGSRIITAVGRLGSATADARARLDAVAVGDGSISVFSDPGWLVAAQAQSLPDGRGLLVIARAPYQSTTQVWHLTSAGADATPVTNDLNDHRIISLSADGRSLVSVSGDLSSAIWIGPRDGDVRPRRRSWGKLDGVNGLCFLPDGRLVYTTNDGGRWSLWTMTPDGGERAPLLAFEPGEVTIGVTVSGRGDVFVPVRSSSGIVVRAVGADGTDRGVVVRDVLNHPISVSRDGALVYGALVDGVPRVFRLGPSGSEPALVTERHAFMPSIEPSGDRVAFYYTDEAGDSRIGIVGRESSELIWSTAAEAPSVNGRLLLREDGLYLTIMPGDRANVWMLRQDGSAPRKITDFDDELLFEFDLSADGGTLAVARGPRVRDAVLMRGFPGSSPGVSS